MLRIWISILGRSRQQRHKKTKIIDGTARITIWFEKPLTIFIHCYALNSLDHVKIKERMSKSKEGVRWSYSEYNWMANINHHALGQWLAYCFDILSLNHFIPIQWSRRKNNKSMISLDYHIVLNICLSEPYKKHV